MLFNDKNTYLTDSVFLLLWQVASGARKLSDPRVSLSERTLQDEGSAADLSEASTDRRRRKCVLWELQRVSNSERKGCCVHISRASEAGQTD